MILLIIPSASLAQLIELAGGVVVNGSRVRQTRGTAASTLVVVASGEGVVKGRGLYPVVTSSWILDCISEHRYDTCIIHVLVITCITRVCYYYNDVINLCRLLDQ